MRFLTLFINLDYLRRQILHPTTQCISTTKDKGQRSKGLSGKITQCFASVNAMLCKCQRNALQVVTQCFASANAMLCMKSDIFS